MDAADLIGTPPPAGAFDLVSAHYFPLKRQPDHAALRGLLDAVAPGGTLLFATHDLADLTPHPEQGFDPFDYYQPGVVRLLDHRWTVLVNDIRPRAALAPAGTHHTHDAVLRAQRLPIPVDASPATNAERGDQSRQPPPLPPRPRPPTSQRLDPLHDHLMTTGGRYAELFTLRTAGYDTT
jgi:SAM-dependent methyltransferase